eukprot:683142-Rhodomonas_salina.14
MPCAVCAQQERVVKELRQELEDTRADARSHRAKSIAELKLSQVVRFFLPRDARCVVAGFERVSVAARRGCKRASAERERPRNTASCWPRQRQHAQQSRATKKASRTESMRPGDRRCSKRLQKSGGLGASGSELDAVLGRGVCAAAAEQRGDAGPRPSDAVLLSEDGWRVAVLLSEDGWSGWQREAGG